MAGEKRPVPMKGEQGAGKVSLAIAAAIGAGGLILGGFGGYVAGNGEGAQSTPTTVGPTGLTTTSIDGRTGLTTTSSTIARITTTTTIDRKLSLGYGFAKEVPVGYPLTREEASV